MLKFQWIKPLISFGYDKKETLETLSIDPDSRLIPSIAEKVILPYINRKWAKINIIRCVY